MLIIFCFTSAHFSLETWAEGVYERPPCFHSHVGGGCEWGPTKVSYSGLRSRHEPEADWPIFTEGCWGDLIIMIGKVNVMQDSAFYSLMVIVYGFVRVAWNEKHQCKYFPYFFSYDVTSLFSPSSLPMFATQAFPGFVSYLEKLAGAIHPLLDAPPVDIPGVTTGSLGKRMAAAKTLMPIVKCGVLTDACLGTNFKLNSDFRL